jgi:hypothetical protein
VRDYTMFHREAVKARRLRGAGGGRGAEWRDAGGGGRPVCASVRCGCKGTPIHPPPHPVPDIGPSPPPWEQIKGRYPLRRCLSVLFCSEEMARQRQQKTYCLATQEGCNQHGGALRTPAKQNQIRSTFQANGPGAWTLPRGGCCGSGVTGALGETS